MSYGEIFNISRAFTKAFASVLHGGFYICPAVTKAITSVLQTGFHICIAVTEAFAPVTDFQKKKKKSAEQSHSDYICITERFLHLYYSHRSVYLCTTEVLHLCNNSHRGVCICITERFLHLYNRVFTFTSV